MRINSVSFVRIGYSHCRTLRLGVNETPFASVQWKIITFWKYGTPW